MAVSSDPWKIYRFDDIDSTMDTACDLLVDNPEARYVVLATQQTRGRGRHQRAWSSPPGNFYATLVAPMNDFKTAPFFSYISALAAQETLESIAKESVKVTLKWPNDLLFAAKKGGGILLELEQTSQGLRLLIGVGMNLLSHPEDTPYPATHLQNYGVSVTPEEILPTFLKAFDKWGSLFKREGFEPLRQAWLKHRDPAHSQMILKGYEHGSETSLKGIFHDLDEQGCLVLDCISDSGEKELRKFSAGDVFFS